MFLRKKKKFGQDGQGEISNGQRYNLIREEENRRYLKELLSHRRPSVVQERLVRVINLERDILKKIRIVENVDSHGIAALERMERRIQLLHASGTSPKKKPSTQFQYEMPDSRLQSFPVEVVESRTPGFFRFLFSDFKKITTFGKLHLLLKPKLSRGRHELSDEFLRFWNVELKVMLNFLEEPLKFFLKEGWQSCSPLQYNLAVRLFRLIRIYSERALLIFDKRATRQLFSGIEPFLSEWSLFYRRPEYKELLLDALQAFVQERKEFRMVSRKILMAAESIFILKKNGPCLKNAMLALFMASRKTFISFNALLNRYPGDRVLSNGWDAAPDIADKIRFYIEARQKELEELQKKLFFLSEMKITGIEQMEEPVLLALYDLYAGKREAEGESGKSPVQSCRQLLKYDLISFFEKVISNFTFTAQPVLAPSGQLPEFWSGVSFDKELDLLTSSLESIRSLRVSHERMTIPADFYKRFIHQQALPGTFSDTERSYCHLLRSTAVESYKIAVKVNHLAAQCRAMQEQAAVFQEATQGGTAGAWFSGMDGERILDDLTGATLGIALILEESSLMALIRRRGAMEERSGELEAELRRMAPGS